MMQYDDISYDDISSDENRQHLINIVKQQSTVFPHEDIHEDIAKKITDASNRTLASIPRGSVISLQKF